MVSYLLYLENLVLICEMARKLKLLQMILRMTKWGKKTMWMHVVQKMRSVWQKVDYKLLSKWKQYGMFKNEI